MHSTVARRLSTLASFYKYGEQEQFVDRNPALSVRRPKVDWTPTASPQRPGPEATVPAWPS